MTKEERRLRELRTKIDALDARIQSLVAQRAKHALAIARSKERNGDTNFYRPEREAEVLRQVLTRNKGPLSDDDVARIFREIMSACLALESRLRVAFLGPEGTFTQEAALKHFGHAVETVPLAAIDEVFREVESGNAHFGVVPVENSTEGMITHTLDMFLASSLKICGEVSLRVHHHLMGRGLALADAKRIVSHQQTLAQCREWLDANAPGVERLAVSSNAEAARRAANETGTLAIAGATAAKLYGLEVLASNIEDRPDNTTRFLIIGTVDTGRALVLGLIGCLTLIGRETILGIQLAALVVGPRVHQVADRRPWTLIALACLLFGLFEAVQFRLQLASSTPPQFFQMLPYLMVVITLAIISARKEWRKGWS